MRGPSRGFTLVEVLVALMLLAILSTFTWQGLDGVLRARDASRASIEDTTRLTTVLTQWEQDLQAVADTGLVPAIEFDGQTLRLTRRVEGGMALVAWAVRGGLWQRWASAPLVRVGALQQAWLGSQQFLGNEPGQLQVAADVADWQVYFYRGSSWTNAQSSATLVSAATPAATPASAPAVRAELPQAVRLVISLKPGKLTRDVALGPTGT